MTEAELAAQAIKHAKNAMIPLEDWIARVRDPKYAWKSTEWGKAALALQEIRRQGSLPAPKPPAPAPTPPASGWVIGQRCVYVSGNIGDDLCKWFAGLGPRYTILFSADRNQAVPGGSYYVTDAQIALCRKGGGKVASWCDGDQTPVSFAVKMASERGLAFASAQFETNAQYDALIDAKLPLGIGNPAQLDADRRKDATKRIAAGTLALIGEVLHPDPDYSAQGIPIASGCLYVDMDDGHGGYQPLASFGAMPDGIKASASLYTGGRATTVDRQLYAQWTK